MKQTESLKASWRTRFVCWFSRWYDLHDYPVDCGGDGNPMHFRIYTCWNCGKEFGI